MTEPTPEHGHDLVAGYLLDALDEPELAQFLAHLPGCAACRKELHKLEPAVADLGSVVEILPPPAIESDLMQDLFGTPEPKEPSGAEIRPSSDRSGSDVAIARAPRRARWAWPLAAAIAFLLGAGVTAGILRSPEPPTAQVQMHEIMEISAAADAHVMPMDVPDGTATVVVSDTMDKGAIVAADLPMPANDDEYHLWTVMPDGSMHSAAAFRPDHQGQASAVLQTGVRDAQGFMLTVEQPGTSHPTEPPIAEIHT